jgi:hypothetical protein
MLFNNRFYNNWRATEFLQNFVCVLVFKDEKNEQNVNYFNIIGDNFKNDVNYFKTCFVNLLKFKVFDNFEKIHIFSDGGSFKKKK